MPFPLPPWLRAQPIVEMHYLEIAPPHLNDNTGDIDRLLRALKGKGLEQLTFNPLRMGRFARNLRKGEFKVTVALGHLPSHREILEVLPGVFEGPVLAFAVDLGTTRLAFYLVDLRTREVIEEISVANPQVPHGEDILTRILFAREERNLTHLQQLLLNTFNETMRNTLSRNGFSPHDVYALAVAGNTTMSHFFLGLDPANICKEPYIPVANHFPFLHARDLDIEIHPDALVYVFPNVGSYFGGDLLAGILAAGLHSSEQVSILVDVGTNAEVVLGNRDWLIACAGAAGPALEGGVVERGMMAAPGAIDRARIDPITLEPTFHVIGEGKPVGICGSGLIDLIAEMFMAGILTIQGKINSKIVSPRIIKTPDGLAYVVVYGKDSADGKDIVISEIDIGIFLKSKAAMYTILSVITNKVGLKFNDLKHFYVAGTFGNYIDPSMAIRIGMIPDLPIETYKGLGNTAGKGAVMLLLDRSMLEEVDRVSSRITYVELNVNMELMNEFRGALFLPHTDPRLFPSVEIPERAKG